MKIKTPLLLILFYALSMSAYAEFRVSISTPVGSTLSDVGKYQIHNNYGDSPYLKNVKDLMTSLKNDPEIIQERENFKRAMTENGLEVNSLVLSLDLKGTGSTNFGNLELASYGKVGGSRFNMAVILQRGGTEMIGFEGYHSKNNLGKHLTDKGILHKNKHYLTAKDLANSTIYDTVFEHLKSEMLKALKAPQTKNSHLDEFSLRINQENRKSESMNFENGKSSNSETAQEII